MSSNSTQRPRDGRPLMVTSALPYANGPLHFGHVAGAYLPADIFVRFQRLRGTDVLFISGTDEHGVAITVNAEKEGVPYADYVARWHAVIKQLFDGFDISFDHFARTSVNTSEHPHHRISQEFFLRLLQAGAIEQRSDHQHYCTTCDRFLPDRFVEGTCYVCQRPAARGDECKACGSWLEAIKLIDPVCATCGQSPEVRPTMQYALDLSPWSDIESLPAKRPGSHPTFSNWITNCFRGGQLKPNVSSMVFDKLLVEGDGLRARDITRDLRWGVPLPDADLAGRPLEGYAGKVLYVWFDAPIGYVTSSMAWCHAAGVAPDAWRRFWITDRAHDYAPGTVDEHGRWPGPRLVHFIGKDNIPFHCVVFPAMLGWQDEATGDEGFLGPRAGERWVLPETVPANEFYNLEGRKFSTSDNWMLDSARMFDAFGVDALRWYLTVTMPETSDSQFRFGGLRDTVNADLANTLGNYASRALKFVAARLDGVVPEPDESCVHVIPAGEGAEPTSVETVRETRARCTAFFGTDPDDTTVGGRLQRYEFRRAAEALLDLARLGNLWFDAHQPWKTRKLDDLSDCRTSLWAHVQILSALAVGLWPFLPRSSDALRTMLALPTLTELDAGRAGRRETLTEADDLWCFQELPVGHRIGEPGILFQKIDEATLEAERARLETTA